MNHSTQSYAEATSSELVLATAPGTYPARIEPARNSSYTEPLVARSIISLEDILGYVLKRWKLATVAALVCSSLLFALMIGRTPMYRSDAGLLLRIQEHKVFNFDKVVNNSVHENSIPYLLNNHKTALGSRQFGEYLYHSTTTDQRKRFLHPVITDRNAAGTVVALVKDIIKKGKDAISGSANAPSGIEGELSAFVEKLERDVHVDVIKETHILTISVLHPDRDLSADLANHIANAYIHYFSEQDLGATKSASEFLRLQADELKRKVHESEKKLFAYRQEQGLVEDDERKDLTAERVKAMSQELTATQLKLAEAEQYLEQIASIEGAGRTALEVDVIARDTVIAKLRDELAVKSKERATIASRYGHKHPSRIEIETAYQSLAVSLDNAVMRTVSEIRNRAALYRRQATELENRIHETEAKVFDIGEKNIELTMLRNQLESDRALHDNIVLRLNEASVSSRFNESGNLRISDTAVPAIKASSPNVPLSAAMAVLTFCCVFTGLPVGLGIAKDAASSQWFKRARRSVRSEWLASIPRFEGSGEQQILREALGSFVDSPDSELLQLVSEIESTSPRPKRCLLVSSAGSGEGKSFMAAAIANLLAAQGQRTLIIDCNLRRPALFRWLRNSENAPTLSDWLESDGRVRFNETDLRCGTLPVFALNAGCTTDVPAELLARDSFRSLILHSLQAFDNVIIDAPAIDQAPEIFQLVSHSSDILLVWDKNKTSKGKLASMMRQMERIHSGTRMLGAVENHSG